MKDNFLVIDRVPETIVPVLKSTRWSSTNSFVPFGVDDTLADFIYEGYRSCSVLKALVDFTASKTEYPNLARQLILYGFVVIVNDKPLDSRYVRFTADRSKIQYRRYRKTEYYEASKSTIIALDDFDTYPVPFVYPCIEAAHTLIELSRYGLSQVCQGFTSSAMISLNNGTPDEKTQNEIQRALEDKFTGSNNAGRVMLSFSMDKEHAPEVHQFQTQDFFSQHSAIKDYSYESLFSTFRATPALIGIHTNDSSGALSKVEYRQIYDLFIQFTVDPINEVFKRTIDDFQES